MNDSAKAVPASLAAIVIYFEIPTRTISDIGENGAKRYHINGPLFFGSIAVSEEKFDVMNAPGDHHRFQGIKSG